MTEQELTRRAKRRLAILRHAEEITGNVALTCRYYGISRQVFYKWRQRYDQHGLDGLRDRSRGPRVCPNQTRTEVVGKIIYLRQTYHFGPANDLADARAALERFYRWSDGVGVVELSRLARTIRAWEAEVLAFHTTGGCSNGPTEAVNLLIKKVKRVGHGFRNFDNYRLRLLLHCGVTWQVAQTARLRGRSPRRA